MKTALFTEISKPLVYQDTEKPKLKDGNVLVKIKAAALNHRDVWIRKGQYGGIETPMILGSDGAGIEEASGDEVIICPSIGWGSATTHQDKNYRILGLPDYGTFAEYCQVPKANVDRKSVV